MGTLLDTDGIIDIPEIIPDGSGTSGGATLATAAVIVRPGNPAQEETVETIGIEGHTKKTEITIDAIKGINQNSIPQISLRQWDDTIKYKDQPLGQEDVFEGEVENSNGGGSNKVIYGSAGMHYAAFGQWEKNGRVSVRLEIPPLEIIQKIEKLKYINNRE
jgi:hypothetical protein